MPFIGLLYKKDVYKRQCQSGLRSYIASRILEGNGYETYNFSGGFRFYDAVANDHAPVSYTHLDVYKRQGQIYYDCIL